MLTLTKGERDVLRLLAEGMRNEQAGRTLSISPLTVRTHVQHAMAKLKCDTRTQAVAVALRESLIDCQRSVGSRRSAAPGAPWPRPPPVSSSAAATALRVRRRWARSPAGARAAREGRSPTPGSNFVPGLAQDLAHRLLDRPRLLVGALVGERVEHVGDRDDPSRERNLLAFERPRG